MRLLTPQRLGAGRERDYFGIKKWMDENGITNKSVAGALGFKTGSVVTATIRGLVNNRKVLGYLRDKGCPAKILSLPEDMRG